jgi:hypothetical protein
MIKKPNLRIHVIEEGSPIQRKVIENIFKEIIAENFTNLGENMDIQMQDTFMTSKEIPHVIL